MGKIMKSYDVNRVKLGDVLPLRTPFTVIIDTSEVCNLKCNYCFRSDNNKEIWGYAKNNNLMDWKTFERIIAQILLFDDPVKQISLNGQGEPLCNRQLPEMVKYIKKSGITSKVSIHTNATLLDEDYVRKLADSEIDRIIISLQGLNNDAYKKVCGVNIDTEYLKDMIQLLYKTKRNTELCVKIPNCSLEAEEEKKFYDTYLPISDKAFIETIVPIWNGTDRGHLDSENTVCNKYGDVFPKQECCAVLFHTLCVIPDGTVYPCTQILWPDPLGDIWNSTLNDMWNGDKRKNMLINQLSGENYSVCKDCYIKVNSVWTDEDLIDPYRNEILKRIKND